MRPLVVFLTRAAPGLLALAVLLAGGWLAARAAAIGAGVVLVLAAIPGLAARRDRPAAAPAPPQEAPPARTPADGAILEMLPEPLVLLGDDRTLLRINRAARAELGDDLPALLRQPSLRAAIERAFETAAPAEAVLHMPVPVPRLWLARVAPLDPPLADGGRALVLFTDRSAAQANERARIDFIANASHELRTPLASLIGFIDTLRGPAADDKPAQERFLGIMAEQGARMNRLIDDLLSLSRIEMTEYQPPADAVVLQPLLDKLAAGFETRLGERGQQLDLAIPADLPAVTADADQLAQVLQNLLDNAIKYGRQGGTIRLSAAVPQPASASTPPPHAMPHTIPPGGTWPARPGVVVSVSDDGIGIAREHLPRLTERFYRVDAGRSRAIGGTGLGLAIVKHIVNRHRGELRFDSEPGQGTTVSIWLPQAAA